VLICHCRAVNDRAIREVALASGATEPEQITSVCGAGGDCGGCLPALEDLLADLRAADQRVEARSAA
jgi:bacterioferritin-associated ferredoxin